MPKFEVKMRLVNENAAPQLDLKISQLDKSVSILVWKWFNDVKM